MTRAVHASIVNQLTSSNIFLQKLHSKLRFLQDELRRKNSGPNPGETGEMFIGSLFNLHFYNDYLNGTSQPTDLEMNILQM